MSAAFPRSNMPCPAWSGAAGERTSFQVELAHRSGQSRFVQMDCVPEHAADGSVVGYICLGSDVSLLKQAELALREDNQLLEQVQARTAELRASKRAGDLRIQLPASGAAGSVRARGGCQ
jgi:uncharacterized protein YkwD